MHCNGSLGSTINGLPLPEHQPLCGEFLEDGGQAAGIGEARPADSRHQLCKCPKVALVWPYKSEGGSGWKDLNAQSCIALSQVSLVGIN